jgi:hypothetical protein
VATYSQDVARYIREGLDEVPGTKENANLQGALSPLALRFDEAFVESVPHAATPKVPVLLRFRDGDHVGEAPMEDIVEGYASGELSEGCQVFDPSIDGWEQISAFLETEPDKKGEDLVRPSNSTDEAKLDVGEQVFMFRDGSHSGEAPFDEIAAGFGDGELSELCEIYDPNVDSWVNITTKMQDSTSQSEKFDGPSETVPVPIDTNIDDPYDDLPLVEKNNQKKPLRGATEWGKGDTQNLRTSIQNENNTVPNGNCVPGRMRMREKTRHIKPPPKLMRLVTQAMIQWDMLEDGDRLLLGLSGGKDSLSHPTIFSMLLSGLYHRPSNSLVR